jgi:hypothetical protein
MENQPAPPPEITPQEVSSAEVPSSVPETPSSAAPAAPWWKQKLSGNRLILTLVIVFSLFGVGAAALIISWPSTPPQSPAMVDNQPLETPAPAKLSLALTYPTQALAVEDHLLRVTGVTAPDTAVMLYTETTDNSVQSDTAGNFSADIELADGVNTLTVSAFSADGQEQTVTTEVVYDSQVLAAQTDKSDNTGSRKVITGLTDEVTPKIIIDKLTKYADENNKPLKSTQLKPANRLVVIADQATTPGQLQKALKIYVQTATDSAGLKIFSRKAVQGIVIDINGQLITLAHQIQRERHYAITVDDQTVFKINGTIDAALSDIQVGQRLIAFGDINPDGGIVARRIHIIPGLAEGIVDRLPVTPAITVAPSITPMATLAPNATPSATPAVTATPSATPAEISPSPAP